MPSTNKTFEYFYQEEYYNDDYENYTEEIVWCKNCCSMSPVKGLEYCECCISIDKVDKYEPISFSSDYWMNSSCEIGERLRRSFNRFHLPDLSLLAEDNAFPFPIKTENKKGGKQDFPLKLLSKRTPVKVSKLPVTDVCKNERNTTAWGKR